LPTLLGSRRVDARCGQPLQMVVTLIGIHNVNRLVATLEPVLNERQQHAILFFVAIEKRADMTHFAELGAGKGNGCRGLLHGVFLPQGLPVTQVSIPAGLTSFISSAGFQDELAHSSANT
jgi:hypothetical protein